MTESGSTADKVLITGYETVDIEKLCTTYEIFPTDELRTAWEISAFAAEAEAITAGFEVTTAA